MTARTLTQDEITELRIHAEFDPDRWGKLLTAYESLAAENARLTSALEQVEHVTADARKACCGEPKDVWEHSACDAYDEAVRALAGTEARGTK